MKTAILETVALIALGVFLGGAAIAWVFSNAPDTSNSFNDCTHPIPVPNAEHRELNTIERF